MLENLIYNYINFITLKQILYKLTYIIKIFLYNSLLFSNKIDKHQMLFVYIFIFHINIIA